MNDCRVNAIRTGVQWRMNDGTRNNIPDKEWRKFVVAYWEARIIVAEWDFELFDLTGCLDSGLL